MSLLRKILCLHPIGRLFFFPPEKLSSQHACTQDQVKLAPWAYPGDPMQRGMTLSGISCNQHAQSVSTISDANTQGVLGGSYQDTILHLDFEDNTFRLIVPHRYDSGVVYATRMETDGDMVAIYHRDQRLTFFCRLDIVQDSGWLVLMDRGSEYGRLKACIATNTVSLQHNIG